MTTKPKLPKKEENIKEKKSEFESKRQKLVLVEKTLAWKITKRIKD